MAKLSDTVDLDTSGNVAVVTIDNPKVNALSRSVRDGVCAAMAAAQRDAQVEAIVLVCAGTTFIAGADIREFGKPPEGKSLPEVQAAIEDSAKPVVAAIHGTALGGGLEVALCCHYRVAAQEARLGLPEVKLGLLPGAGGTQRLPRLLGVEKALEMILGGEPISAQQALAGGLVDELTDGAVRDAGVAFARKVLAERRPPRRVRDVSEKLDAFGKSPEYFAKVRAQVATKSKGFHAPAKIVECLEAAVSRPFDDALAFERAAFLELLFDPQSAAQRYYFFAEREAAKVADVPKGTAERTVEKVGVVGAGTMGGGIAMNFLNAGTKVVIVEQQRDALDRGLSVIRKNYERSASRGKLTQQDVEQRMSLLTPTLELQALHDRDLVIEAVFENMALKKDLFGKLDRICKPGAILATNTSYLDVNEIAAATRRPADVLGMHFFSPANVMKLLEVVRGKATAKDVIATAMGLGKRLGKIPVLVGVCRGFVGNRILAARRDQAMALLLEGAMPWDVDRVLEDFGMPMGPFAMGDLAGLDIGWDAKSSRGDAVLRDKLCELGRRGQKTSAGYYRYDPQTRARTQDPVVEELVRHFAQRSGVPQREIGDDEILERCSYVMVNEGAKILEEGIAQRASDIDVVWVGGYGWPVYRGGPMHWADGVGLARIVASLGAHAPRLGAGFQLSPLLQKLAAEGKHFTR